jgi:CheY-like chemotaxis protein
MNVLIADDEAMIRRLMRTLLEKRGHRVFEASDGVHAVALFGAHQVHVLITDVVMKEMDGFSLAATLTHRNPNLPVLFVSGYPVSFERQHHRFARSAMLRKPFQPADLLQALSELVGTPF